MSHLFLPGKPKTWMPKKNRPAVGLLLPHGAMMPVWTLYQPTEHRQHRRLHKRELYFQLLRPNQTHLKGNCHSHCLTNQNSLSRTSSTTPLLLLLSALHKTTRSLQNPLPLPQPPSALSSFLRIVARIVSSLLPHFKICFL